MWDLWSVIKLNFDALSHEIKELERLSKEYVEAENEYQAAKHIRSLELQEEGMSATLINMIIKGDPTVSPLLQKRNHAEKLREVSNEKINVIKLQIRVYEKQLEREWSSPNVD